MIETSINGRWTVKLPAHRAARPEWGAWVDPHGVEHFGWEPERLDSMHEHLMRLRADSIDLYGEGRQFNERHPRPVIIDVGAEEGDLTALYSTWGCDVIMVEPNPRVWPNIKAIWEANDLRQPRVMWVGFAGEMTTIDGTVDPENYRYSDEWPPCASGPVIGDHAFLHLSQHSHLRPTLRLDDLKFRIGAITIDTEGSELTVLRGADRILREHRPLVWVSVHSDEIWMDENYPRDRRDDILAYMAERGYTAEHLATDHEEHWFFRP